MFSELRSYEVYVEGAPWVERAPAHWSRRRLKTVAKHLTTSLEPGSSGGPYIALEHVEGWTGRLRLDPAASYESQVKAFQSGDVLFAKLRPYLAKVVAPVFDGVCANEFMVIRPEMTDLTQEYLTFLMRSAPFIAFVNSSTEGARMPRTDWGFVGSIEAHLPSIAEQDAIVEYLAHAHRRIDRAIAAKRRLIVLLEEQKQAVINQFITRGPDPDVPMSQSGVSWIGEMPDHWESSTIGRVQILTTSGSRGWAAYYSDDGALFIQSRNLGRDMKLDLAGVQLVDLPSDSEGIRTEVRRDDILLCITGARTGNVVHVGDDLPGPAYVNQHIALIRPRAGVVTSRYLAYAMRSSVVQEQWKAAEYGGTKQGLGLADVKGAAFPRPSLIEQQEIVASIDALNGVIDRSTVRVQREIELLEEFRTRLTADVVTGQVDVREIAAGLPDIDPAELEADVTGDGQDNPSDEAADDLEDVLA